MRRKIPPIPLEIIMDDPRTITLPAAGRGMLLNLCWHFWTGECSDMPRDRDIEYSIACGHRPTWNTYRDVIRAIMSDAAPAFIKARELRDKRHRGLRQIRERATGAIVLARLAREANRAKAKLQMIGDVDPTPKLSEKERAARVGPPAKVDRGFSQRRVG